MKSCKQKALSYKYTTETQLFVLYDEDIGYKYAEEQYRKDDCSYKKKLFRATFFSAIHITTPTKSRAKARAFCLHKDSGDKENSKDNLNYI